MQVVYHKNGITTKQEVQAFLNPSRHDFYDPFLMPDMKIAVNRILKAIENHEKVIIYGDYDADGITSITVLKKFLSERGLEVGQYIPNRLDEGYGLNKNAIDYIKSQEYTLMITVDCGISGIDEIEYAKSLGIEVIVTDHHEPAEELPKCLAVIDAKRKDNTYPFNQLAGVGVVFKLIQAISIQLNLNEKEYLKYLDIVCVGTISDIVPLIDENRVIAKLGLKLISVTNNIGLNLVDFLNELLNVHCRNKSFWNYKEFVKKDNNCLVHGDLNSSNILLDENNHISAIIDFGFGGFGNKYFDIARIIGRCPDSFKNDIVKSYENLSHSALDNTILKDEIDIWTNIDNSYIDYMKNIGIYK